MTLQELENALDRGKLECQWPNGKWYAVRRNGQTKRWKRDESRFRIPCKTGFREYFCIGDTMSFPDFYLDSPSLRIRAGSMTGPQS